MTTLYTLTKRHILLYVRDRSAVFFSMLSVLIVLLLMLVFLGDMNKDELMQLVQQAQGSIQEADAMHLITMWTIAGILVVNAFTVPITMIGIFIQDKEQKKLESFYCSCVPRSILMLSYLLSAVVMGFVMCILLLVLSFCYVSFSGYAFLNLSQVLQVCGLLLLCTFVSSALVALIAHWVNSDHAWGAFSTLAGTLIGFLGGIYLPVGMLPSAVQGVLKSLPFLHETAIMRDIFTASALRDLFHTLPASLFNTYREAMGITVSLNNQTLSVHIQIVALLLCGIIALAITVYLLNKHTTFNR